MATIAVLKLCQNIYDTPCTGEGRDRRSLWWCIVSQWSFFVRVGNKTRRAFSNYKIKCILYVWIQLLAFFFYFSNGCCCPKRSYLYLFIYFLKFDEWVKRGKVNKILRGRIYPWVELKWFSNKNISNVYLKNWYDISSRENLFTQRNKSEYPPPLFLRVLHLLQFVQAKICKI